MYIFHDALVSFAERRVIYMKNKKSTLAVPCMAAVLGVMMLTACGTDTTEQSEQTSEVSAAEDSAEENSTAEDSTSGDNTDSSAATEAQDGSTDTVFAELAKWSFSYSSGAGAWSTDLSISEDGTFTGFYHDSEAGSTGTGYPNGTVYVCNFSGKFTTPEQVDEYTWKTTIESISCEEEVGKEELADDVKYIYSEPLGLTNAEDIYIYKKGIHVSKLPEEYCTWIYDIDTYETLPFYGIYNEKDGAGFYGWSMEEEEELSDSTDSSTESLQSAVAAKINGLEETEKKASEIRQKMETDESLTQLDYNELSRELYTLWDDQLNTFWKQLKTLLDEDTMNNLTAEEKEWIQEKDRKIQEAGADYAGGSLQEEVMNQTGADLTRARVYELAGYLQ